MTRVLIYVAIATLTSSMFSIAQAGKPTEISAHEADFTEVVPGVSKKVLWGDHDQGPYGAFTRFTPGLDNGMHTHTNKVRIVVLKGAYVYRDDDGERRIEAGDFLLIPGGKKHWSGGDTEDGALFYEASKGKFDLVPVGR